MLTIHHLGLSRSDRIIWLAEELALDYQLVRHERDPETFRSPPSLWKISPMGKAPVIEDRGRIIPESGAIVEYLLDSYGRGRLRPPPDSEDYVDYLHWLHAAESTLMTPVLMNMIAGLSGVENPAYSSFVKGEFATVLGYMEKALADRDYIAGAFSAADIMVAFPLMMLDSPLIPGPAGGDVLGPYANIQAYLLRLRDRPKWLKAEAIFRPE